MKSDYLIEQLGREGRKESLQKVIESLAPYDAIYTAIAFTGVSGALIAPIAAHVLGKDLIVVRKDGEMRHSSCKVEGPQNSRYIIVDDFISTGNTVRRIIEQINAELGGTCIGAVMYKKYAEGFLTQDEVNNIVAR